MFCCLYFESNVVQPVVDEEVGMVTFLLVHFKVGFIANAGAIECERLVYGLLRAWKFECFWESSFAS